MISQQSDIETRQTAESIEEIDFQKYWLVLKRRWFPALLVFCGTVALSAAVALREEPTYYAEGRVRFKSDRTTSLTGLSEDLGQIDILGKVEPLQTQAEIVKSFPIMERVAETAGLTNGEGERLSPQDLLRKVAVKPLEGTEILLISSTSGDPEEAVEVVNEVIEAYRELNIESNKEEAAAARRFIEEQLPLVEREVLTAEAELRQFKDDNNVIILEEEASEAVSRISQLEQAIEQAQADLSEVEAQTNQLQERLGLTASEVVVLSSLNQSAGVQDALSQLQTIESEIAESRSVYNENHPQMQILLREKAEVQALLQSRVADVAGQENSSISTEPADLGGLQLGNIRLDLMSELANLEVRRVGLVNRLNQLFRTQSQYQLQMDNLPELEKVQRQLERQLLAAQTTYETLLTQLQEIRVVENQTVGNVQVVSLADESKTLESKSQLYIAAGVGVGLLLGIATAFLIDLLDSSVKTIRELKELYGYTLLGVIPFVKESGRSGSDTSDSSMPRLLVDRLEYAGVREAYQILQANLKFLQSDTEIRTVVLTSAISGEGKSEVAVNLAAALAQVGKKVILIDADMRYPRQHRALKVLNHKGLSHVITGQATVKESIQSVMQNLDVLTAGAAPPNPVALLDSKKMQLLLQSLSQDYEMVIVDAPPIAGYADASILGRMSDGILLVARLGLVNYAQGRSAKDILVQSQQRVLGVVANGINPANEPDGIFYLRQGKTYSEGSNIATEEVDLKTKSLL